MKTFPVMNVNRFPHAGLTPRMGQARDFKVLPDEVLSRICDAVDAYNNADTSWSSPDAAAGERTQRDSTSTVQSVIDSLPANLKNAGVWEIRKYCPDADSVLDTVRKPGPETPPAIPTGQDVASVDRYVPGPYTPPPQPPPTAPPVASVDRYIPGRYTPQPEPISTGFTPFTTGSESEPQFNPPPPPPVETPRPPPQPPPVASSASGCWYVMGQGYMWGPRPSGGESTGLNQRDCESLIQRDREVRGLPMQSGGTAPGQLQIAPQDQQVQNVPVSTGQQPICDPMKGQFIDPVTRQCRGSVASIPNIPGGGITAPPTYAGSSFMGRRVVLRGANDRGNIDWWMYQQAFIPQLFFARPRVRRATLGAGKPVPPGVCCQATEDGGAICSTGQGFPPDCPNKPEPNVPGVAKYIQQEGYMVPKPPPAPVNGVCSLTPETEKPKEESSVVPPLLGIAAVGAVIYGLVELL